MKLIRQSNGAVIDIDERAHKLGDGGEGIVYRIGKDLVAKIYQQPSRDARTKIEAMVQSPPDDTATKGHRSIAWPIDLLMDAGRGSQFRGYLMPRVDAGVELHRLWEFATRVKLGYTTHELHVIALNIASAFQALHQKGYVVGDVNDRNIMINERGLATVIDTDSFQVPRSSGGRFRCTVGTGEFTPPELQMVTDFRQIDRSEAHDLFGLGVLLFKVLMLGHHPFSGNTNDKTKQGWSLEQQIQKANFPFGSVQSPFSKPRAAPGLDVLAPELCDMFIACFEGGKRDPDARPRAADWRAALNRARKELETCEENPQHRFTSRLSRCPWCEIRDRVQVSGKGLDLFPTDVAQIPLPKPARPKVKVRQISQQGVSPSATSSRSGGAGRPSSGISTWPVVQPASSSASASSPASSATSGTSTPTVGQVIGGALLGLLANYLQGSAGSQSNGSGPVTAHAQPEIGPGRWQFQLGVPPQTWDPVLVAADVYFNPIGRFNGRGLMAGGGRQMPCQIVGNWQYDEYGKVLTFDSVINGMPVPREQLRIVGGGNGQYRMVSAAGYPVDAVRLG